MRPRTTLVTTVAIAALALAGAATMAVAAADEPSAHPAMHNGIDLSDMVSMHDAMIDADTGMAAHMNEVGGDPGQMRDWTAEGDDHGSAWMHD